MARACSSPRKCLGPSRAEIATAPYFAGLARPCVMVQARLTWVDRVLLSIPHSQGNH